MTCDGRRMRQTRSVFTIAKPTLFDTITLSPPISFPIYLCFILFLSPITTSERSILSPLCYPGRILRRTTTPHHVWILHLAHPLPPHSSHQRPCTSRKHPAPIPPTSVITIALKRDALIVFSTSYTAE
ncbi:hypothetical protein P154DRAFT_362898 [Amniculicola lignicola CBS 123094]|uniref:Uncharacterized protein n=1 Tax=Amniculicola lignicola CBS 123094 TaxID=1392246 RepID=A0A6A5W1P2_9PLEO|nr:hypothetical protein P154DRAFT_362898 [Amniculicola lignicola CBS 123094]